MESFAAVITTFGVPAIARILRIDESHVRTMKARDSIPPEYWGDLIREAARNGVTGLTYNTFLDLRSAKRTRPPQEHSGGAAA